MNEVKTLEPVNKSIVGGYYDWCDKNLTYSTFEQFIFGLFQRGEFDTGTIKQLINIHGRDRIEGLYKKWNLSQSKSLDGKRPG